MFRDLREGTSEREGSLFLAVFVETVDAVNRFSRLHHVEFIAGDDREILHVGLEETFLAFVVPEALYRLQIFHFKFRRAFLKLLSLMGLRKVAIGKGPDDDQDNQGNQCLIYYRDKAATAAY